MGPGGRKVPLLGLRYLYQTRVWMNRSSGKFIAEPVDIIRELFRQRFSTVTLNPSRHCSQGNVITIPENCVTGRTRTWPGGHASYKIVALAKKN